jgi:hypothetical protein
MEMNLRIKNTTGITLDGNKLSGNTFPVKDWVKNYLGGKWDGDSKTWIVDVAKVNDLIAKGANIYVDNSQPAQPAAKKDNWKVWAKGGWELGEDY